MIEQLREQIKVVAKVRGVYNGACQAKRYAYDEWEKQHVGLLDAVIAVEGQLKQDESKLRELTLEVYAETGNKTPAEGVGIREVTKLEYDTKTAYSWAIEHSMALNLDKRGFEKIAKVSPPDFVTITKEPQATIATNLEEKNEP